MWLSVERWYACCPFFLQECVDLRERFFGSDLELQPYAAAYGHIWVSGDRPGRTPSCFAETPATALSTEVQRSKWLPADSQLMGLRGLRQPEPLADGLFDDKLTTDVPKTCRTMSWLACT